MFKAPKIAPFIALASIAFFSVPAAAKVNEDGASRIRLTIEKRNGVTVYCGKQQVSGSFIPLKTCFTKDQWVQRGAEFNVPQNALASK